MEIQKTARKDPNLQIYNFDSEIKCLYKQAELELSPRNYELFCKFDQKMVMDSLAKAGRRKSLRTIITLTRMSGKDFDKMTRDDVNDLVFHIMQRYCDNKGQETHMSYDSKKHIRLFLRWVLTGSRYKSEDGDPLEIRGIKLKMPKDRLSREDMITTEDLKKLLNATAGDAMIKALIHVQYEAGTRPGELLNLKIKHVRGDEYGAIIAVDGKTNARPVRLIESVPSLMAWLSVHPMRDNPESPLWIQTFIPKFGEHMTYYVARNKIRKVVAKSKLNKRIFMNLFRHSEATRMAGKLTESELKKRQGWTASSKMPARYVHMVDSDVEEKILSIYGLKKDEKKDVIQSPKACPICSFENSFEVSLCSRCGKPLDLRTSLDEEERKKEETRMMINEILRQQQSSI
jgi:integrase